MSKTPRRPIIRWAWRLFRRDWRQQLLVLALLTIAVTAAIAGSIVAANAVPSRSREFGNAGASIQLRVRDAAQLAGDVAAIRSQYGALEVIGHRALPVPGSTEAIDVRTQRPGGRLGAPMLRLTTGRYPVTADEVAVTDGVAHELHVAVGQRLEVDGGTPRVVGVVENPGNLDDEFALTAPTASGFRTATVLLGARVAGRGGLLRSGSSYTVTVRGQDEGAVAAAVALLLSSILLVLIALVATAGFAVVARRRLRQLGMLASVGATDAQLRAVLLGNGLFVGVVAATVGTGAALGLWVLAHGRVEQLASHRIGVAAVPVWVVVAGIVLSLVTAMAAAWWPARSATRVPVTDALAGRPPRPVAVRRSIPVALVLAGGGFLALAAAVDTVNGDANGVLLVAGALALVAGMLLLCAPLLRAAAFVARRTPLPVRLAVRDLNRDQSRSGAALAAISLGLGIAVAIVVIAGAAQDGADEGNLSDRQVLIRSRADAIPPERATALDPEVRRLAASIHGTIFPLEAAAFSLTKPTKDGTDVHPPVMLGRRISADTLRDAGFVYVATPELLARAGIVPKPGVDVYTATDGPVDWIAQPGTPPARAARYDAKGHSSAPANLITEEGLRRTGFGSMPVGWFVETAAPLSDRQLEAIRATAARLGLVAETRSSQQGLLAMKSAATAAGVALALCLLAMTIGLIRSEAGRDLQTLAAVGATSRTRRAITAATSGAMALLGSALGTTGALVGLVACYLDRLSDLSNFPLREITVLLVGLPLLAAAGGWALAGREPASIARAALD